ncbi:MAG: hypothetical protein MR038_05110 [Oscillospiraceae bacterium]|nr:hypothetical protein [Oscillospiraceae bacterium]
MCNISLLYFNRGFEKGYKEGFQIGYEEGFQIGYEEGFQIGYEEETRKARLQIMIEMYKNNIPIQTIANVAHLSVGETEKIINDNT